MRNLSLLMAIFIAPYLVAANQNTSNHEFNHINTGLEFDTRGPGFERSGGQAVGPKCQEAYRYYEEMKSRLQNEANRQRQTYEYIMTTKENWPIVHSAQENMKSMLDNFRKMLITPNEKDCEQSLADLKQSYKDFLTTLTTIRVLGLRKT
ncbi:MAG TPA: hypothetical protein VEL47_04135 [Myxococcota bacterium]|nr:hypothetical protein [Myxococcota bacterium]